MTIVRTSVLAGKPAEPAPGLDTYLHLDHNYYCDSLENLLLTAPPRYLLIIIMIDLVRTLTPAGVSTHTEPSVAIQSGDYINSIFMTSLITLSDVFPVATCHSQINYFIAHCV